MGDSAHVEVATESHHSQRGEAVYSAVTLQDHTT